MALIQTVHLSMANFKSAPVVPAVQNDTDRKIKMVIDDLDLTAGLTGKITFVRSDGTHYEASATLDTATNSFTADIDQALTQPGRTMVQLKVTDTLTVSTFSFVIFVEEDTSGTVTPQEGIDLVTAVEAAEDAADRAESAAETLELDATLTSPTKAAQAKAVGDAIDNILDVEYINDSTNLIDARKFEGKQCSAAFTFESYSIFIPLQWGEKTTPGGYTGWFVLNDGTSDQTALNAITLQFADENKDLIGNSFTQSYFNGNSINVSTNAKYIKLTMYNWTSYTLVRFALCKGTTYAAYQDVYISNTIENLDERIADVEGDITNIDTSIDDLNNIIDEITVIRPEGSFYNFESFNGKGLFGTGCLFSSLAPENFDMDISNIDVIGKSISTFLWLDDGQSYETGYITEVQLDANGDQIYPESGYHYIGHPMIILPDCKTIRLYATQNAVTNCGTSILTHAQLSVDGDTQVNYTAKYFVPTTTTWKGKKWVAYGDSITAQNKWQPYVVGKIGFETVVNAGLGGSSVADGNDQSIASFTDSTRINALPTDADIVTIMGGTNDFNGTNNGAGSPLGDIPTTYPYDTSKFIGALCETVRLIQARCPKALIVILSNVGGRGVSGQIGTIPPSNGVGLTSADYANAAKSVAEFLGLPFVDVHECGINPFNRTAYISDSVHPNSAGGEMIARCVIDYLQTHQPI